MPADRLIIVRRQQPPECCVNPQHREVRTRYEHAVTIHRGLSDHRDVHAEQEMPGDSTEGGVRLLEIAEHRIAEHLVTVARLIARVGAVLGARCRQVHQALGLGNGQRPKQDLVEQRVDRRVRADAERQ